MITMDTNNDTELDYEEDDLEGDCAKSSSENKFHAEDKVNEVDEDSNISGVDDQYLQIDFTEDDENFTSNEVPLKTDSCENQNVGEAKVRTEADEKIEESKEQIVFSGNERFTQNKNNGNVNHNGGIAQKKKKTPYAPWRRGYNWLKNPWFPHDNQIPSLIQDFYLNQNSGLTLLNLVANQQEQNWQHLRNINQSFSNYLRLPFVSSASNSQMRKRKIFPGNVHRTKVEPLLQNVNIRKKSTFYKNLNITSGNKGKNQFDDFCDRKTDVGLNDLGIKNVNGICGNGFPGASIYSLKEDEKKLIELKKEARLKRFFQGDPIIRGKKSLEKKEIEASSEERSVGEQQLVSKEQQSDTSIFDNVRDGMRKEKPYINKESLLKKRNPFETSVHTYGTKIKCLERKSVTPLTVQKDLLKPGIIKKEEGKALTVPDSIGRGVSVAESDADSGVKFVRTVLKSFDELVHKTRPESQPSDVMKTLPFTQSNSSRCPDEDITQVESQLTGCIVKVLNVPPSTTKSDVLELCSPIGKVLEVKLNVPRENSVVIRFAESIHAEQFFSLYHGQKMKDYFLNVIVV